jgi:hypothetical protein
MEFEFGWMRDDKFYRHGLFPIIKIKDPNEETKKMFLEFLCDYGGRHYDAVIPLFVELRDKIGVSKYDQSINKTYCTQSWCASVSRDLTIIFFAYKETHEESLETDLFYKVLCEWIDFVQQGPGQEGEPHVRKFTV